MESESSSTVNIAMPSAVFLVWNKANYFRLFRSSLGVPYIVKNCDNNMEEAKEPQMIGSSKSWNRSVSVVAQVCDFINGIGEENTLFAINVNEKQLFFMIKVQEGFLTFEADQKLKDIILSSCLTFIQSLIHRCEMRSDLDQVLYFYRLLSSRVFLWAMNGILC
jgi:hypothetical protein